jgi:hypothetical protein
MIISDIMRNFTSTDTQIPYNLLAPNRGRTARVNCKTGFDMQNILLLKILSHLRCYVFLSHPENVDDNDK